MSISPSGAGSPDGALSHPMIDHGRRRFLIGSAAFLANSVIGATPAHALFLRRRRDDRVPQFGYHGYLASLRLRRITPEAVIEAHQKCRGKVSNCLPPKSLWANIKPVLRVADEMAKRLGAPPVRINSAYRSLAYNTRIGGAKSSQHLRNCALDLKFACGSSKASLVARQLREEGFFSGGIGIYSGFVHIDTRGTNETWWG